ncbi:MAG: hypothetical protein HQL59_04540 [Magnetococcales bacterium]|nr:hypothetical protein [Magnetococcales bacterium]
MAGIGDIFGGLFGGNDAPPPPDPLAMSNAQAAANSEAVATSALYNQTGYRTPFGEVRWEGEIGRNAGEYDPVTGEWRPDPLNRVQIYEPSPQILEGMEPYLQALAPLGRAFNAQATNIGAQPSLREEWANLPGGGQSLDLSQLPDLRQATLHNRLFAGSAPKLQGTMGEVGSIVNSLNPTLPDGFGTGASPWPAAAEPAGRKGSSSVPPAPVAPASGVSSLSVGSATAPSGGKGSFYNPEAPLAVFGEESFPRSVAASTTPIINSLSSLGGDATGMGGNIPQGKLDSAGTMVQFLNPVGPVASGVGESAPLARELGMGEAPVVRPRNVSESLTFSGPSLEVGGPQRGLGYTPGTSLDVGGMPRSLDYSGLPQLFGAEDLLGARKSVEDALYGRQTAKLDPQFRQEEEAMKTELANRGIPLGSEAYTRAVDDFFRRRQDAYAAARQDAIQGGGAEMANLFGMGLQARQQGLNERVTGGEFGLKSQNQAYQQALSGRQQGWQEALGSGDFNLRGQEQAYQQALSGRGQALQEALSQGDYGLRASGQNFQEALTARGQIYSEAKGAAELRNAASSQAFQEAMARAGLFNQAQAQEFGQQREAAQFANTAQQQLFQEALSRAGLFNQAQAQDFGQRQEAAKFANAAQSQAFQEAISGADLLNRTQAQEFGQRQQAGQFANAAQNQAFQQEATRASLANEVSRDQLAQALAIFNAENGAQAQQQTLDADARYRAIAEQLQMAQSLNDARSRAAAEMLTLRSQPYTELASLLTGQGMVSPFMTGTALGGGQGGGMYQVAPPNVMGAISQSYAADVANSRPSTFSTNLQSGGANMLIDKLGLALSSRRFKEGNEPVDDERILQGVTILPVEVWRYRQEVGDSRRSHIGPYAEDFREIFGLGDGVTIDLLDMTGILLVAVKALEARVRHLERASVSLVE